MSDPLEQLDPADQPLLDLAFERIDDSMLREIAEADYGTDADAHLKALDSIRGGEFPNPMEWEPKEVLELIRWSEPGDPSWKPGSTGERGHWMRLFSCAVLIRAAAEPDNEGAFIGEDSTIIQLVDSAITLGQEAPLATLRFLCWRLSDITLDDSDRPYFAVAILLLCASLNQCDPQTIRFLMSTAASDGVTISELLGECQQSQTWKDIVRRLLIDSMGSQEAAQIDDELKEFGKQLIGG